MNMQGVDDINLHEKNCGVFYEYDCDCVHSYGDGDYMMYDEMEPSQEQIDKWEKEDQDGWMYDEWEPPIRRSKSAKPKMGVSGKSVLLLQKLIGRKGKKK